VELLLGRFVEEVADRYGSSPALVYEGRTWTYLDLLDAARAAAKGFLALGVSKGSKVGLLMGNRLEFVQALFGAGMIGVVAVPINTLAVVDERNYIIGHSDSAVLVLQESLRSHRYLEELEPARFPFLRNVITLGSSWDEFLAGGEAVPDSQLDAAAAAVHPSDDALIVYTSGTTAHPKAVVHMHRAPVTQFWRFAEQMQLERDDRIWSSFPLFWTAGLAMALGGTLAAGACLVMQETFEPGEALRLFEVERVTTVHAFDHAHSLLADHPDVNKRDLSSIRNLRSGTPLHQHLKLTENWDMRAAYGMSETFTIATSIPATASHEEIMRTHGVPLPGMKIRVVDPSTGASLPAGEIGEIAVKGVTLMRTYYKTFPEEVFDDEGWFRTQDAGWIGEDGHLHWTGRLSNIVKTGGANVSPVEVEYRAMELGYLAVAAAFGLPHPTLDQALVLCAILRPGSNLDPAAVLDDLRPTLASYKLPRRVFLLTEDEVGFTSSDKIRLDALPALAARRIIEAGDDPAWAAYLSERGT
jgi:fatty-acyl-CoA synthase